MWLLSSTDKIATYVTRCVDKSVQISDEYENVFFYAFNMDDGKGLEKKYGFEGVPLSCHVRTGGMRPRIHFLEELKKPHKRTCITQQAFVCLLTSTGVKMIEALTYDDVLLLPHYSDIRSRSEVDISTDLGNGLKLGLPIISSSMDSIGRPYGEGYIRRRCLFYYS